VGIIYRTTKFQVKGKESDDYSDFRAGQGSNFGSHDGVLLESYNIFYNFQLHMAGSHIVDFVRRY